MKRARKVQRRPIVEKKASVPASLAPTTKLASVNYSLPSLSVDSPSKNEIILYKRAAEKLLSKLNKRG